MQVAPNATWVRRSKMGQKSVMYFLNSPIAIYEPKIKKLIEV